MAEFQVVISEMNTASSGIQKQTEVFRDTSNMLVQAAEQMHETGWHDEAVEVFLEKVHQLDSWAKEMATIMEQYSKTLTDAGETYTQADQGAAKNFG